jgi:hypothetical protein
VVRTRRLILPPGPSVRELKLAASSSGGVVTASILRSGLLPEDEQIRFLRDDVEPVRLNQWLPAFKCFAKQEDDRNWPWWRLWAGRFYGNSKEPIEYFVVCWTGLIQGMMVVGPSKEANLYSGKRLLYLANMATAPWNRKKFLPSAAVHPRPLRLVGTALVKQAVSLSKEYGYGGRVGLRAMGGSKKFYAKIGMKNLGKKVKDDEVSGHAWFEFSDEDAQEFLDKSGP